jgi:hypothetical protein
MNIAFPAFLLIVLIFPGIVFRRYRYGRSPFRTKVTLADEIGLSIFAALIFHAGWFYVCEMLSSLTGLRVSVRSTVILLSGRQGEGEASFGNALNALTAHPNAVFLYFASLFVFAGVCGFASRYTRYHIGRLTDVFFQRLHNRIPNEVIPFSGGTDRSILHLSDSLDPRDDHSSDSGERRFGQWLRSCELDEAQAKDLGNHLVFVIVAAVVELGGKPFLFRGTLDKAFFSSEGDLERLTLKEVCRRAIDPAERDEEPAVLVSGEPVEVRDDCTRSNTSKYYSIDGDTFILRMTEVKTINFLFGAFLPPEDEPAEASSPK